MKPFAPLLLLLPLGCAGSPPAGILPFDLRPVMGSMREDAAEIARILGDRRVLDAVQPARRLAEIRLGEGQPLPPEFLDLEQNFRTAAKALAQTLAQPDRPDRHETGVRFKRLLQRCDACHQRYRPGGISGL